MHDVSSMTIIPPEPMIDPASADDGRHAGQGLDVIDEGRAAPQPRHRRVGRPGYRRPPAPLEGSDEGGLLAADERPCPHPDLDVEGEAALGDVGPEPARPL